MTDAEKFEQKLEQKTFICRIATPYLDEYNSDFFNVGIKADNLMNVLKIIEHKYGKYTEVAYIEDEDNHKYQEIIGNQRFTMSLVTFRRRLKLGIIK